MMKDRFFTKEESERIGLLSQLNIEKIPVERLKSLLKDWRKEINKKEKEGK